MSTRPHLPRDPALPHLAHALDETLMGEQFGNAVRKHGLHLERCQVERIKYRPHRNCALVYRLLLRDTARETVFEQRVAARLSNGTDAARRSARAREALLLPTHAGPTVMLLPGLDMVTWWWPNDPKIAAPGIFADDSMLRNRVLPAVVAAVSAGRGTLSDYRVHVAQYVPEHRLCVRVDVQWQADGQCMQRTVYAKASREPDGATAHAILRDLQASSVWRQGRLRTPRALLWQPQFDLHWQEGMPGSAMLDLPPAEFLRLAAPLGEQLAALHGTAVATTRELSARSLQARLVEAVEMLGYILPGTRGTLQRTAATLADGIDAISIAPFATLHGDLHARNILVDQGQMALIDLDGLRRGPAVIELGAWIADGMYRAVLDGNSHSRESAAWASLLKRYADAGGAPHTPRQLAWATAWNLLCQRARRCVVNLKPGRFAIAPRLIELACDIAKSHELETA